MNNDLIETPYLRKIRHLTIALMISGAINIFLIAYGSYPFFKDHGITSIGSNTAVKISQKQYVLDTSNSSIINSFEDRSFEQLINKLNDRTLVENGYTIRDLALGYLVSFHYFDLTRALGSDQLPEQMRVLTFNKKENKITVFPGINEEQFQQIQKFAQVEKWPLTSEGLFVLLKQSYGEKSLQDAFALTDEYISLETLFNYNNAAIEKKKLIELILESDWNQLKTFFNEQKIVQDLSMGRLHRWLLDNIHKNSKLSAYTLIEIDPNFAILKLDNNDVAKILELTTDPSPEAAKFALMALTSPRNDSVWKLAAIRLYEFAGEQVPQGFLHHAALSRFVPAQAVEEKAVVVAPLAPAVPQVTPSPQSKKTQSSQSPRYRIYIVQEGDNLWKISKRFKVDIETIKKHNKFDTEVLKPGSQIKLPA